MNVSNVDSIVNFVFNGVLWSHLGHIPMSIENSPAQHDSEQPTRHPRIPLSCRRCKGSNRRETKRRMPVKCGRKLDDVATYDIDHIVPLWDGGTNEHVNLQALCLECHRRKCIMEVAARVVRAWSSSARGAAAYKSNTNRTIRH